MGLLAGGFTKALEKCWIEIRDKKYKFNILFGNPYHIHTLDCILHCVIFSCVGSTDCSMETSCHIQNLTPVF